jgi:arginine-tRNA-protein transferase
MNPLPIFRDVTVYDEQEPCPYLEGETARLPLRIPGQQVTPRQTDQRFAEGQRRTGEFVYTTCCAQCRACEPIRIPVRDFRLSRTHKRTLRRNQQLLTPWIGPVVVDTQRVELFNLHRRSRDLGRRECSIDTEEYAWAFQRSCFDTFEMSWSHAGRLVAVAICDQGAASLSAVYTYFDPQYSSLSPGTWSILQQIEYCRQTGRDWLYLGFYIRRSAHMAYKARFLPHQRLVSGQWQTITAEHGKTLGIERGTDIPVRPAPRVGQECPTHDESSTT